MKSFRLYLQEPTTRPRRQVADIPEEEQAQYQEAFEPVARRYRRHQRVMTIGMLVGMGCFFLTFLFTKSVRPWGFAVFVCVWLALLVAILLVPKLICPACHNKTEDDFGPYCPECGAHSLQKGGWFSDPHCSTCRRSMRRRKRRRYTIRACTHCGVWLDNQGV